MHIHYSGLGHFYVIMSCMRYFSTSREYRFGTASVAGQGPNPSHMQNLGPYRILTSNPRGVLPQQWNIQPAAAARSPCRHAELVAFLTNSKVDFKCRPFLPYRIYMNRYLQRGFFYPHSKSFQNGLLI